MFGKLFNKKKDPQTIRLERDAELRECIKKAQLPLWEHDASVVRFTIAADHDSNRAHASMMLLVNGRSVESIGHFIEKHPDAKEAAETVLRNIAAYVKEYMVEFNGDKEEVRAFLMDMSLVAPYDWEVGYYATFDDLEDNNKRLVNSASNLHIS